MNTRTTDSVTSNLLAAEIFAAAARHLARHGHRPAAPYDYRRPGAAVGVAAAIQFTARRTNPWGHDAGHSVDLFADHLRDSGGTAARGGSADVIAAWETAIAELTANCALEPVAAALYAAAAAATRRVAVLVSAPCRLGRELSTGHLQALPGLDSNDQTAEADNDEDAAPCPEWVQLSGQIADMCVRGYDVPRRLMHRIRHLDPAVEAARTEAICAGMADADWDCWYVNELDATLPRHDATAETVRLTAAAAAPVILHG